MSETLVLMQSKTVGELSSMRRAELPIGTVGSVIDRWRRWVEFERESDEKPPEGVVLVSTTILNALSDRADRGDALARMIGAEFWKSANVDDAMTPGTWMLPFIAFEHGSETKHMLPIGEWVERLREAAAWAGENREKVEALKGYTAREIKDKSVYDLLAKAIEAAAAFARHEAVCAVEEADVCQSCDAAAKVADDTHASLMNALGYVSSRAAAQP